MRKIIVGAFVSLDGVMQAPGGPNEDPIGPLFNRITKYVATCNSSVKLDWQNSQTWAPIWSPQSRS